MDILIPLALAFTALCVFAHLLSTALALWRFRPNRAWSGDAEPNPPVSFVIPVCGLDAHAELTLGSLFRIHYPRFELLFCVASPHDPVVPLITRLMTQYPDVDAQLLFGEDRLNDNPKLNNLAKGWRAAVHNWIIIADSNVFMPRDPVRPLIRRWEVDTGLVCSPPVGARPESLAAELECAFLNTYQARWQYCADALGLGFAQGKLMLWRREDLEAAGGVGALATDLAEDAAATKLVRALRMRVRLVDRPFVQPLGVRSLREVWHRQVRWARLRRGTFRRFFAPEILSGALPPVMAAGFAAYALEIPVASVVLPLCGLWYGAEALLAYAAGWHLNLRAPALWVARDILIPPLWIAGWLRNEFVWRGHVMQVGSEAHQA